MNIILSDKLIETYTHNELLAELKNNQIKIDSIKTPSDIQLYVIRCNKLEKLYLTVTDEQKAPDHYDDLYIFLSQDEAFIKLNNYMKAANRRIKPQNDPYYGVDPIEMLRDGENGISRKELNIINSTVYNIICPKPVEKKYYKVRLNESMHKYIGISFNKDFYKDTNTILIRQACTKSEIIYFDSIDKAELAKKLYIDSDRLCKQYVDQVKNTPPVLVEDKDLPANLRCITISVTTDDNVLIGSIDGFVDADKFNSWMNK